jgi:hypothetical protein
MSKEGDKGAVLGFMGVHTKLCISSPDPCGAAQMSHPGTLITGNVNGKPVSQQVTLKYATYTESSHCIPSGGAPGASSPKNLR